MVDNILLKKLSKPEKPAWVIAAEAATITGIIGDADKPKLSASGDARSRTLEQDKRHKRRKCWCGKRLKKGRCPKHAGFTCKDCEEPRRPIKWISRIYKKLNKYSHSRWKYIYTSRCKQCNRKKSRRARADKAFDRIQNKMIDAPGLKTWFITLTRPNICGVEIESPAIMGADKDLWVEDFHRFRRRKIWKENFAGGYWFYEVTTHKAGEKIFSKKGEYIRTAEENEINGHLHIVANADRRIPMKELAASWGNRVDFRQPRHPGDVRNYLRGYLTKCDTSGVNMRPFGNIHRKMSGADHK